jgi:FdhD protein
LQPITHYPIVKISYSSEQGTTAECIEGNDLVVTEEPLEIWMSSYPNASAELLFTTMRTPGDDLNLVCGWLYSSGAISDFTKIKSITHRGTGRLKSETTNRVQVNLAAGVSIDLATYQRVEIMNSACGVCGQQSIENILDRLPLLSTLNSKVALLPIAAIRSLIEQLRDKQSIFGQTGGSHGAALFDQHLQILDVREDVGRHNAVDKLIGANIKMLAEDNPLPNPFLGVVLSSRASFELVQKAAMVNVRFIIAIGAPTSLAIDLAKECDICLLGFIKTSADSLEFNVYSSPHLLA